MSDAPDSDEANSLRLVTNEEMRSTYNVPTVITNRFVVSTNPANVRIAFGETLYPDDTVNWRIALSLSHFEALELKEVLSNLLAPFEAQLSQGTSKDGTATK